MQDETSLVNGEKDKEIVNGESLWCDESVTSMELPVPVADSSLFMKSEGMKKNDRLEGNAVLKVDEIIRMADSYQVGDGTGMNFDGNNKQLAEAALDDQVEVDGKEHMPAEKCNENGEVMIEREEVLLPGIQLSEKLEYTTMYRDHDILCSDSTITKRHENEICGVKKADLLLPMIDSLSSLKPADSDLVENVVVIEDTTILEGGEADKTAVQEDSVKVKDRGETQLVEEKDRSANVIFAHQIMSGNKALVQLVKNDEMKSFNNGSENDVAEGDKTLEIGLMDICDGSKNDEESPEITQTESFELENNQQSPLKKDNCYDDNSDREEVSDSIEDEENSDRDCDKEDTVNEDEESSETTGRSSLDSNVEAIWPAVESVQEFSQKVKHIQTNKLMEIGRGHIYSKFNRHKLEEVGKENFEMGFSNKLAAEITTLRQPSKFSILKFWFLSLLVPFLLWLLSSQISSLGSSNCHIQ